MRVSRSIYIGRVGVALQLSLATFFFGSRDHENVEKR